MISNQQTSETRTINNTVLSHLPIKLLEEINEFRDGTTEQRRYANNLVDAYFVGQLIGEDVVSEYKQALKNTKNPDRMLGILLSEGFIKVAYHDEILARVPEKLRPELKNLDDGLTNNRLDAIIIGGRSLLQNFDNAYTCANGPEKVIFDKPGLLLEYAIIHPSPQHRSI